MMTPELLESRVKSKQFYRKFAQPVTCSKKYKMTRRSRWSRSLLPGAMRPSICGNTTNRNSRISRIDFAYGISSPEDTGYGDNIAHIYLDGMFSQSTNRARERRFSWYPALGCCGRRRLAFRRRRWPSIHSIHSRVSLSSPRWASGCSLHTFIT